ncbi:threonine--tRNA ligase [Striga asiatica]|uniref:Threonine--tRNA ligase n=1 Tax=Striga asiatica TaxID=4170 RepID=A0A5A7PFB8_STRAF|nr:threonine--tRNA ligase [Striga asiatica]
MGQPTEKRGEGRAAPSPYGPQLTHSATQNQPANGPRVAHAALRGLTRGERGPTGVERGSTCLRTVMVLPARPKDLFLRPRGAEHRKIKLDFYQLSTAITRSQRRGEGVSGLKSASAFSGHSRTAAAQGYGVSPCSIRTSKTWQPEREILKAAARDWLDFKGEAMEN